MQNAGRTVTRTMLLENVWNLNFDPRTNVVESHISRLRSKIDRGFPAELDPHCSRRRLCPSGGLGRFQSESFRHAVVYAGLFAVSLLLLTAIVYVTMDRAFKADLLRASNDDLLSIQKAYAAGLPRGKGVHEAREMIEDRIARAGRSGPIFCCSLGRLAFLREIFRPCSRGRGFFICTIQGAVRMVAPVEQDYSGAWRVSGAGSVCLCGPRYIGCARDGAAGAARFRLDFAGRSILLAAVSGLVLGRSFLRRVEAISDTCHSIMAGRLGERIAVDGGKTELERLAKTINGMLDRIQALMESLKQILERHRP